MSSRNYYGRNLCSAEGSSGIARLFAMAGYACIAGAVCTQFTREVAGQPVTNQPTANQSTANQPSTNMQPTDAPPDQISGQPASAPTGTKPTRRQTDASSSEGNEKPKEAETAKIYAQWQARLGALSPSEPEAYYLLAEEVADAAPGNIAARQVAARLFVLAMNLDLARNPMRPVIAGSACVALADLDPGETDSPWLLALAEKLDPRQSRPDWLGPLEARTPDSTSFRIATAIGMIRAGDGIGARRILGDRAVEPTFRAMDRMIRRMSSTTTRDIMREAGRWPCLECGNARAVKKQGVNPPEYRACTTCQGAPGPNLSVMQLTDQLRLESLLLGVGQRSWAAQVVVDHGAVVVDPDPEAVGRAFGVDPRQSIFREGAWTVPGVATSNMSGGNVEREPASEAPVGAKPEVQQPEIQRP